MWHSFPLVQPQLYLHLLLSVFVLSPQFLQYLNASTLHFPVVSNNWNLVTSGHIEEQLDRLKKNKEISMYFLALEKQKKVFVCAWLTELSWTDCSIHLWLSCTANSILRHWESRIESFNYCFMPNKWMLDRYCISLCYKLPRF